MSEVLPLTEEERQNVILVSGSANQKLAEGIASFMGTELSPVDLTPFDDGETFCVYEENIRKRDVFIINAVARGGGLSPQDALMQTCQLVQAANLASAKEVNLLLSYYGYGRQDRKAASRTPISAVLAAEFYEVADVDVLMAVDMHSQQIQGFFRRKFDAITVFPELRERIRRDLLAQKAGEYAIGALDAGATKIAQQFAEDLDLEMLQFIKRRGKEKSSIDSILVPPGVAGKTIIAIEDIIATGGTSMGIADKAKANGADGFWIAAAHSQFVGDALEKAPESAIDRFYVTNTLETDHILEALKEKGHRVPVEHVLGEALLKTFRGESLQEMFNGQHLR